MMWKGLSPAITPTPEVWRIHPARKHFWRFINSGAESTRWGFKQSLLLGFGSSENLQFDPLLHPEADLLVTRSQVRMLWRVGFCVVVLDFLLFRFTFCSLIIKIANKPLLYSILEWINVIGFEKTFISFSYNFICCHIINILRRTWHHPPATSSWCREVSTDVAGSSWLICFVSWLEFHNMECQI